MQRNGKLEFDLIITQLTDHFGNPCSRNRNSSGTHPQSIRSSNPFNGLQHVLVVEQWLTHAHENNIGQFLFVNAHGLLVEQHNLVINLIKTKVSLPFHEAGSTEFATQAAANLGGNAGGKPFNSRNQNTFHLEPIVGLETGFYGSVLTHLLCIDRQGGQGKFLF